MALISRLRINESTKYQQNTQRQGNLQLVNYGSGVFLEGFPYLVKLTAVELL